MKHWAHVPTADGTDDQSVEKQLAAAAALFESKPSDQLHVSFILLVSSNDQVYVASHSILRLCGALSELLDEIDADTSPAPYPVDATTAEILDLLPAFEVDAPHTALVAVLEFLVLWLENGRPSALVRPLSAPLQHLVLDWEWSYLQEKAFAPKPRRPTAATALAAVVPFVREPTASRLYHQEKGVLSTTSIAPLLMLMRAADFLGVDPLRDLTCALLASLVMDKSEAELAELLDLDRPLTEAELEPMFVQHPFLRAMPAAGSASVVATVASPSSSTPTAGRGSRSVGR